MCLAVPGKIKELKEKTAVVDISGNAVEADISLLADLNVGDYVIVHAGIAIEKYEEAEAKKTLDLIDEYLKD